MNYLNGFKSSIFLVVACLLFNSCKKQAQAPKKPFKLTTSTYYRVSPKAPEEIIINGETRFGTAFFPGGGTGNATHMGNVSEFFNQQVYSQTIDGLPVGSVAAPVSDITGYPIIGGPLPLIQTGDFAALAAVNSSLQIPSAIQGKIISTVIYNKKGDAVFLSAITGSGGTFPISETTVGFNGKALIVTGRGKFRNAVGELDYQGYFNVANPNDAGFNAEGWISY